MSKSPRNPVGKPGADMLNASYRAGVATGRIEAIEESMDAVAELIIKAEALSASLREQDSAVQVSASHTLRALHLAFAAVTGSVNGSAAFRELLDQSRQRLLKKVVTTH